MSDTTAGGAVRASGPLLALTNARAGTALEESVEAAVTVLRAETQVEVVRTDGPDDVQAALERLGDRRPVVFGGDGSIHVVVNTLHRLGTLADTCLGLVPLGTGNDLARSLGIPLDPVEAARVVLFGPVRPMEIVVDDEGRVVVNAIHLGVGAQAARDAERWKSRLGMGAYKVGSVAAGFRSRGWRLQVTADGETLVDTDRRTLMVGLSIGRTIGGGDGLLAPDADPNDGLVDVTVSLATRPLARVGYALHLRRGAHGARADVITRRATTVTVSGQPVYANADGEVNGPWQHRTWRVQPDGWRLTVPDRRYRP